ncbi:MAG: hypothetical protein HOH77_12695, partial [Candidatus Latescibacteria bacterium]|nr:hypothetical protein [Candidatus Latescibacterota bacterium]
SQGPSSSVAVGEPNGQNPDGNAIAVGEPNGQNPDGYDRTSGGIVVNSNDQGDRANGEVSSGGIVPIGVFPGDEGPQTEPGDTPAIAVGEELPPTQVLDSDPGVVISDGLPIAPGEVHGLPTIQKTDIRGSVSTLDYASEVLQMRGVVATIFVEGAIEADTHIDKARVTITRDTQIIEQQGQDRRNVGIDALLANQRVQISFTGPVMESYPVQATASEIVILK